MVRVARRVPSVSSQAATHLCNVIGIALDAMDALTAGEEEVGGLLPRVRVPWSPKV